MNIFIHGRIARTVTARSTPTMTTARQRAMSGGTRTNTGIGRPFRRPRVRGRTTREATREVTRESGPAVQAFRRASVVAAGVGRGVSVRLSGLGLSIVCLRLLSTISR